MHEPFGGWGWVSGLGPMGTWMAFCFVLFFKRSAGLTIGLSWSLPLQDWIDRDNGINANVNKTLSKSKKTRSRHMAAAPKSRAGILWLRDRRLTHKNFHVLTPLPTLASLFPAPHLTHLTPQRRLLTSLVLSYTTSSYLRVSALLVWTLLMGVPSQNIRRAHWPNPPRLCWVTIF